jgi:class 3 adenylate cyclase/tetratricopeptide (TPR) repeat protein
VSKTDERKPVTILFTDVADSTALGERIEPEAVRRVMLRYFESASSVVERHGGTVEKFIGDAVMAVFGVPTALEDHASRAVRAALELQVELGRLNRDLQRRWGVQIAIRTGVNSGEVVAGDESAGQALVTGDPVNVAARLQQSAAAGETLIGEATRRLVGDAVEAEEVEPLSVRGKTAPLAAWRLVGARDQQGANLGPLLGRESELRQLRQTFERVAYERSPQRVVLVGSAGIGKTRLAREAGDTLSERATVLVGRCLPYGEGIAFWALAEIVRQLAGDEDPLAAIERVLDGDPRSGVLADRVLQAAGLEEATAAREDLTGAVRDLFAALARKQPVVLVLEDLHWAEPALLDLIEHLLERTTDAPLMLVCLARQELIEQRPAWARETHDSSLLELGPLSPQDTRALIRQLLPAGAASEEVREQLTTRAEGNPLFLQQMIAYLRETGDAADVSVPPTIHALLAARLDRLPAAERRAIGAASVIGREFWAEAVAEVVDGADTRSVLEALARKQLIAPEQSTLEGETGYAFSHILVRDAAYESINKEERAELHERLADWLEQRHPERMIEIEAILGHHLERAYRYRADLGLVDGRSFALGQRAAARLASAGRRAARAREDTAAVGLLERAGALLPVTARGRLDLLPAIGESLEGTANHRKAGEIYEEALERAQSAGDRRVEGLARLGRAHVWFVAHPDVSATQLVEETERAIRLLEHTDEERGLADAWRLLGESRMYEGRASDGQQALEQALRHADPDTFPRHWNAISFAMGMCLLDGPAHLERAVDFAQEHLAAARERSMRAMEADMLHVLGVALGRRGSFDEARAALLESTAISEDMGLLYMAQWSKRSRGRMELAAGDATAAERALRESWDVLTQMGLQSSLGETAVPLAEALYAQGRLEEADSTLKALKEEWASDDAAVNAPRLAVRAKLLAAEGWTRLAEETADRALRVVRPMDWLCLQVDALLAHADVMLSAGRQRDALASTEEALRIAEVKGYEAAAITARRGEIPA